MQKIYGHSHHCMKVIFAFFPVKQFNRIKLSVAIAAASKSRIEVCSLLLGEKADPTLLNCHNKTAIDSAPTRELQERIACKYIESKISP